MKRFWLLPLAALSLAGAASVAQAAPGSSMLGELKALTSPVAGKAEQVNWRWYHHRRHHQHHRRHHHRRG